MTLDEAIEVLSFQPNYDSKYYTPKYRTATSIVIEAGKRCLLARKETSFVGPGRLPGETKEVTIDNQVKPKSTEVVEN